MGNYILLSRFYFLRISTIFCFVGAVLISLFYECDAYLMHYGNCNAESTIIRSVLRENQNCSGDEVEVFPN